MNGNQPRRLRGLGLAAVMLAFITGCAAKSHEDTAHTQSRLTTAPPIVSTGVNPDDFRAHVEFLAHDTLAGRGIGTPGIDIAAGYIAGQFATLGVEPGIEGGSYFQTFEVATERELVDDGYFELSGVDADPVRGTDYIPFSFSSDGEFEADVVFAGYGIVNENDNHDDYKDFDVEGKAVLVLRRMPADWDDDRTNIRHAMFRSKVYEADERGAAAVLIVNRDEGENEGLVPFSSSPDAYGLPAFHITRELAEAMLAAGGAETLDQLQARVDEGEFVSTPLSGVRLSAKAGVVSQMAEVRNVVGLIRGDGPLADEYVVIGAHYDHIGRIAPRRMFGALFSRQPEIHNGADDNASGTAGVIEAARMLHDRRPLRRSVLLVAFTGEETGLHGSRHFVNNPPVALDQIVAMLNMDMIGRLDDETLQVFGTKAAVEFEEMIPRIVQSAGLQLRGDKSALGPSDHTHFYRKKIPSLHFFTGLHEDYHRPSDDADRVNAEGGARVTDVVVAIAEEIINTDERPTYFRVQERATMFGQAPRVVMGIMPGYMSDDGPGMKVEGVLEDGPAVAAGMHEGDRIVRIDDTKVNNIHDYMSALRDRKAGDRVTVIVVRGEDEVELDLELAER